MLSLPDALVTGTRNRDFCEDCKLTTPLRFLQGLRALFSCTSIQVCPACEETMILHTTDCHYHTTYPKERTS